MGACFNYGRSSDDYQQSYLALFVIVELYPELMNGDVVTMKLVRATIENYRCYDTPTTIEFSDITALIGRNDVGKSSIMEALDLFFNEHKSDQDDCCVRTDSPDIKITCEFSDPPESVVLDETYPTTLANEYLLNARGNVEMVKVFPNGACTKTKIIKSIRALHPTAAGIDDLLELSLQKLKARARELGVSLAGVDERAKAEVRRAIWNSVPNLQRLEKNILVKSDDLKAVGDKITNSMPLFSLFKADRPSTDQDEEAQDPMKLAVKQAIAEQQAALDRISEIVESEIARVAEASVQKLAEVDSSLAAQFKPRITTKPWASLFSVALTDEGDVPINKRGSGVRRLILLSFLRAKAENAASESGKTDIILGIEEPETSQHPNNQVLLMDAFQELSEQGNYQVILTTHNPALANRLPSSAIRFLEGQRSVCPTVITGESGGERAVHALGMLPNHRIKLFIGVEGTNDINFWKQISEMLINSGEGVPNVKALELENSIVFIPLGGSNLQLWANRLSGLNVPELHIFDRDAAPGQPTTIEHRRIAEIINQGALGRAFISCNRETENYLHPDAICEEYSFNPITIDGDTDVPAYVAECHCRALNADVEWNELNDKERKRKESDAKKRLNTAVVSRMTPDRLTAIDPRGFVLEILARIQAAVDEDMDRFLAPIPGHWM